MKREEPVVQHQRRRHVTRRAGALDIGQGAVVCAGLVLAVEAQEGTDAMLRRCAELPPALRGGPGAARGVLADPVRQAGVLALIGRSEA